jgi:APA family basic amino acid/polyamine antiporter
MLGALWAYDGWNNVSYVAGEVKHPERNLPLALSGGMFIVMSLYVLVNVDYYRPDASRRCLEASQLPPGRACAWSLAVSLIATVMMLSS